MSSTNKNTTGGHSHPQNDRSNPTGQDDSRKSSSPAEGGTGNKSEERKESFGKSGAKDSH